MKISLDDLQYVNSTPIGYFYLPHKYNGKEVYVKITAQNKGEAQKIINNIKTVLTSFEKFENAALNELRQNILMLLGNAITEFTFDEIKKQICATAYILTFAKNEFEENITVLEFVLDKNPYTQILKAVFRGFDYNDPESVTIKQSLHIEI